MKFQLITFLLILSLNSLYAHPHIFIDYRLEIENQGKANISWTFDPIESEKNLYYFDNNSDGVIDSAESEILFNEGFSRIKDYNYFLIVRLDDKEFKIKSVSDFDVTVEDDKRLTYSFSIEVPYFTDSQKLSISHFDTSYFISFAEPTSKILTLRDELYSVIIKNKKKPYYYDPTAGANVVLDTSKPKPGWIKAYPTEVFISEEPFLSSFGTYKLTLMDRVIQLQKVIYFKLSDYLTRLKNGEGFLSLLLILFFALLYGIVHALGPGHRKVFISSYLLSHKGATYLKAISMSMISALTHSGTGILIVSLLYLIFSKVNQSVIDNITTSLKGISYIIPLLLSIILIIIKLTKKKRVKTETKVQSKLGLSLIMLISIIPCPISITVMLFSLSLNMINIGILTVLFMSLGIGITLTATSLITVKSKNLISSFNSEKVKVIQLVIEWTGLVLLFSFSAIMTSSLLWA